MRKNNNIKFKKKKINYKKKKKNQKVNPEELGLWLMNKKSIKDIFQK